MTNRVGQSLTMVDFGMHIPTTKFESCVDAPSKVGLFIGAENVLNHGSGSPRYPLRARRRMTLWRQYRDLPRASMTA